MDKREYITWFDNTRMFFGEYMDSSIADELLHYDVVNGRFCPQSVRNFCPIVAGFNAGTYKVPACVL